MKEKFYTMALLAGLAFGASAAEVSFSELNTPQRVPVSVENKHLSGNVKPVNIDSSLLSKQERITKKSMKVPATPESLEGEYVVTYNNAAMRSNNDPGTCNTNSCYIQQYTGWDGDFDYEIIFPFLIADQYGEIHEQQAVLPIYVSGNTITIKPTIVNIAGSDVSFHASEPYVEQNRLKFKTIEEYEIKFNGSGFTLTDPNVYLTAGDETSGYYFAAEMLFFGKSDTLDNDLNLGWTSLGTGKFQDGWIISGLTGGAQSDPSLIYDVEIQQNEENPNLYRIVSPYGAGKLFQEAVDELTGAVEVWDVYETYNQTADLNGFIQFNASDPDHVIFDVVPSNFNSTQAGVDQAFPMNTLTRLVYYYGYATVEEVVTEIGDQIPYTTLKDGILTVPSTYDPAAGYVNDGTFGVLGDPYYPLGWFNQDETGTNMEAKIWFPGVYDAGVEGIEFDDNAPVKYYNLQGVEVADPQKGQLVIKTQGAKAQKMIVR